MDIYTHFIANVSLEIPMRHISSGVLQLEISVSERAPQTLHSKPNNEAFETKIMVGKGYDTFTSLTRCQRSKNETQIHCQSFSVRRQQLQVEYQQLVHKNEQQLHSRGHQQLEDQEPKAGWLQRNGVRNSSNPQVLDQEEKSNFWANGKTQFWQRTWR